MFFGGRLFLVEPGILDLSNKVGKPVLTESEAEETKRNGKEGKERKGRSGKQSVKPLCLVFYETTYFPYIYGYIQ